MDNELEQQSSKIAIFKGKQIRKVIHQGEWYFSIIDVVTILTESSNPRRYWSDLKTQICENEGFAQLYGKIVQLKLLAPDGKMRETDTANTETIFRIIQFETLEEAGSLIEIWRKDYNQCRPHSSLKGMTPEAYAKEAMKNFEKTA